MKIEIIQRCRVRGVDCIPGTIVETDKATAYDRIGAKKAKKYVAPPPPEVEVADGAEAAATEEEPKRKKKKKEDG